MKEKNEFPALLIKQKISLKSDHKEMISRSHAIRYRVDEWKVPSKIFLSLIKLEICIAFFKFSFDMTFELIS